MNWMPDLNCFRDSVAMLFDPRGTISKALDEFKAEGGPDLDMRALADQAYVSVDWLYRLEQGQLGLINLAELERLCRILGRSSNDILGYEADA